MGLDFSQIQAIPDKQIYLLNLWVIARILHLWLKNLILLDKASNLFVIKARKKKEVTLLIIKIVVLSILPQEKRILIIIFWVVLKKSKEMIMKKYNPLEDIVKVQFNKIMFNLQVFLLDLQLLVIQGMLLKKLILKVWETRTKITY